MTVEDAWDTLVAECPTNGATMSFGRSNEPGGPYVGLLIKLPQDKCDVRPQAGHLAWREIAFDVIGVLAKYGVLHDLPPSPTGEPS